MVTTSFAAASLENGTSVTVPVAPAVTLVYSAERNGGHKTHSVKQCASLPIFPLSSFPPALTGALARPHQKYLRTVRVAPSSCSSSPLCTFSTALPSSHLVFLSAFCPLRLRFRSRRLSHAASFVVVAPSICQARPSQGVSGEKSQERFCPPIYVQPIPDFCLASRRLGLPPRPRLHANPWRSLVRRRLFCPDFVDPRP